MSGKQQSTIELMEQDVLSVGKTVTGKLIVINIPTSQQLVESHTGIIVNLDYYIKSSEIMEFKKKVKILWRECKTLKITTVMQDLYAFILKQQVKEREMSFIGRCFYIGIF